MSAARVVLARPLRNGRRDLTLTARVGGFRVAEGVAKACLNLLGVHNASISVTELSAHSAGFWVELSGDFDEMTRGRLEEFAQNIERELAPWVQQAQAFLALREHFHFRDLERVREEYTPRFEHQKTRDELGGALGEIVRLTYRMETLESRFTYRLERLDRRVFRAFWMTRAWRWYVRTVVSFIHWLKTPRDVTRGDES